MLLSTITSSLTLFRYEDLGRMSGSVVLYPCLSLTGDCMACSRSREEFVLMFFRSMGWATLFDLCRALIGWLALSEMERASFLLIRLSTSLWPRDYR